MPTASLILWAAFCLGQTELQPIPETARLVIDEDWSSGQIDPEKWYLLRKQWGAGNHGVVPENVRIEQDTVHGRRQNVLVCTARGDRYTGPVTGLGGHPTRVGGVIVSKPFLASGRYEVVMKIGSTQAHAGGPANPAHPRGAVPAIWTYGYRFVQVDPVRTGTNPGPSTSRPPAMASITRSPPNGGRDSNRCRASATRRSCSSWATGGSATGRCRSNATWATR